MENDTSWIEKNQSWLMPFAYFFSRIILFLALIPNDYYGFGDLPVYYEWTALPGWPYLDYWVEYPPLFPFLSKLLFSLARGQVFLYDFLMCIILALAGSATIYFFQKIANHVHKQSVARWRSVIFFGLMLILPYTWWYAELLTVFWVLASIWWIISNRQLLASIGIAAGVLSKWFPLFIIPALFRHYPLRQFIKVTLTAMIIVSVAIIMLLTISPEMTLASLKAQPGRSSWQTLWALLDGNLTTGAFLFTEDRLYPEIAGIARGNPPLIPPGLTFLFFGAVGIWLLVKRNRFDNLSLIAFTGMTWALFLLWSPGWSPQWILYLLPLILLSLPIQTAYLLSLLLVGLTILEWPFMLTRHIFTSLWIIVPLRMIFLLLLIGLWTPQIISRKNR